MKNAKRQIKPVTMDFGKELLRSTKEFRDAILSGDAQKLTIRKVKRFDPPPVLKSRDMKSIRAKLALSQTAFAEFVGVSPQLVRAWEQGQRKPSKLARRFLHEIRSNVEHYRSQVV